MNPGLKYAPCPSTTSFASLLGKFPIADILSSLTKTSELSGNSRAPPTIRTFFIRSVIPIHYTIHGPIICRILPLSPRSRPGPFERPSHPWKTQVARECSLRGRPPLSPLGGRYREVACPGRILDHGRSPREGWHGDRSRPRAGSVRSRHPGLLRGVLWT